MRARIFLYAFVTNDIMYNHSMTNQSTALSNVHGCCGTCINSQQPAKVSRNMQTFVSRTRLAVQRAEDMTATPFEEDNISVVPSDQGQAPGQRISQPPVHHSVCAVLF